MGIFPTKYSHSPPTGFSPCSTLKNCCRWLRSRQCQSLWTLPRLCLYSATATATSAGWRIPSSSSITGVSLRDSGWPESLWALGRICRHPAFQQSSLGIQCSSFIASPGGAGLTWRDYELLITLCFPNLETGGWRKLKLHTYYVPSISTSLIFYVIFT